MTIDKLCDYKNRSRIVRRRIKKPQNRVLGKFPTESVHSSFVATYQRELEDEWEQTKQFSGNSQTKMIQITISILFSSNQITKAINRDLSFFDFIFFGITQSISKWNKKIHCIRWKKEPAKFRHLVCIIYVLINRLWWCFIVGHLLAVWY